jgi:hypothetical protein
MSTHSMTTSPSPAPKEHHHAHDHGQYVDLVYMSKIPVVTYGSHHGAEEEATVPWFPSPMDGWNDGTKSFAPRHEASTIELFFDLWFVGMP